MRDGFPRPRLIARCELLSLALGNTNKLYRAILNPTVQISPLVLRTCAWVWLRGVSVTCLTHQRAVRSSKNDIWVH
jgi:hypothetical protein